MMRVWCSVFFICRRGNLCSAYVALAPFGQMFFMQQTVEIIRLPIYVNTLTWLAGLQPVTTNHFINADQLWLARVCNP